jgi:hypothetical protein
MTEPSDKLKDVDFLVTRIGLPAVILAAVLWFHFHSFENFRKDLTWKLERSIRNERAIMQKLGIAVILDGDRKEDGTP